MHMSGKRKIAVERVSVWVCVSVGVMIAPVPNSSGKQRH